MPIISEYTCTVHKGIITMWLYITNYTEKLYEIALVYSPKNIIYAQP